MSFAGAVTRLKKNFYRDISPKKQKILDEIVALSDPGDNFSRYREYIKVHCACTCMYACVYEWVYFFL